MFLRRGEKFILNINFPPSLCPAGTKYSPGGLSLLGFCFIFSSVGSEEGSGQTWSNSPFPRPLGRIRPQHSWGQEGQPGVRGHSRC